MTNILSKEIMFGKKILVTGASGLIGRAIVKCLLGLNKQNSADIRIYACGRSIVALKNVFKEHHDNRNLELCEFDINKEISINVTPDFVIHCAAITQSSVFVTSPTNIISDSINAQKNILDFCVKTNVSRFIFLSSLEVYGNGKNAFKENDLGYLDIYDLRSVYPYSKRICEMLCASYKVQHLLDFVCIRLGKVFSPDTAPFDKRIGADLLQKSARKEDIVLNTKGTQIASYCYIDDAVAAVLSVLTAGKSGEVYNACECGEPISAYGFAEICAKVGGCKLLIKEQQKDFGYSKVGHMIMNFEKITNLGFVPHYNLQTAVQDAISKLRRTHKD